MHGGFTDEPKKLHLEKSDQKSLFIQHSTPMCVRTPPFNKSIDCHLRSCYWFSICTLTAHTSIYIFMSCTDCADFCFCLVSSNFDSESNRLYSILSLYFRPLCTKNYSNFARSWKIRKLSLHGSVFFFSHYIFTIITLHLFFFLFWFPYLYSSLAHFIIFLFGIWFRSRWYSKIFYLCLNVTLWVQNSSYS